MSRTRSPAVYGSKVSSELVRSKRSTGGRYKKTSFKKKTPRKSTFKRRKTSATKKKSYVKRSQKQRNYTSKKNKKNKKGKKGKTGRNPGSKVGRKNKPRKSRKPVPKKSRKPIRRNTPQQAGRSDFAEREGDGMNRWDTREIKGSVYNAGGKAVGDPVATRDNGPSDGYIISKNRGHAGNFVSASSLTNNADTNAEEPQSYAELLRRVPDYSHTHHCTKSDTCTACELQTDNG